MSRLCFGEREREREREGGKEILKWIRIISNTPVL
jgi:hypothetical protein